MNQAFRTVIDDGASPRFRPTPFVFGGNMAITRDLFSVVPFDPAITRGALGGGLSRVAPNQKVRRS